VLCGVIGSFAWQAQALQQYWCICARRVEIKYGVQGANVCACCKTFGADGRGSFPLICKLRECVCGIEREQERERERERQKERKKEREKEREKE